MIPKNRQEARTYFLALRKQVHCDHPEKNAALNRVLLAWLLQQSVRSVGFYRPFRSEPDVTPAIAAWLQKNPAHRAAVPVVDDLEQCRMHYAQWHPGMSMQRGAYGIETPENDLVIEPEVVLAPCVAFTPQGFRLGNGKGFFDRYLAQPQTQKMITVAVAFDALMWSAMPLDSYDVPMQWIATESGVRAAKRNRGECA